MPEQLSAYNFPNVGHAEDARTHARRKLLRADGYARCSCYSLHKRTFRKASFDCFQLQNLGPDCLSEDIIEFIVMPITCKFTSEYIPFICFELNQYFLNFRITLIKFKDNPTVN